MYLFFNALFTCSILNSLFYQWRIQNSVKGGALRFFFLIFLNGGLTTFLPLFNPFFPKNLPFFQGIDLFLDLNGGLVPPGPPWIRHRKVSYC